MFDDEEFFALIFETGYRKALTAIQLDDREELVLTLRQYHTVIRDQVELDQFVDGLNAYAFLSIIRQYPQLLKPLLVSQEVPLSKRVWVLACIHMYRCMYMFIISVSS